MSFQDLLIWMPPYREGVDYVDIVFFEVTNGVFNESAGDFRSIGKS